MERKESENQVADHLSKLEDESRLKEWLNINDSFPDEQVLAASIDLIPWFADFANFLVSDIMPEGLNPHQRKKFLFDVRKYFWDDLYLFRICADGVIKRCIPEVEMLSIMEDCHSSVVGGHHGVAIKTKKILLYGYYWPTIYKDAHDLVLGCDQCQRQGNISKRQELSMTPILEVEIFDAWGIDFMGPFVSLYGMKYILVAVNYVSK